jgi:hypothetical protein
VSAPEDRDTPVMPEPHEEPIPEGKAHLTVAAGFLEVLGAISRLEAVCAAVARQLDAAKE